MMKTGWWSVQFDLTLEGKSVDFDDLDLETQNHICECILDGCTGGEIVENDND